MTMLTLLGQSALWLMCKFVQVSCRAETVDMVLMQAELHRVTRTGLKILACVLAASEFTNSICCMTSAVDKTLSHMYTMTHHMALRSTSSTSGLGRRGFHRTISNVPFCRFRGIMTHLVYQYSRQAVRSTFYVLLFS